MLGFFARSFQIALPEFEINDIVASDDLVVALTTIRWRRNDNSETFEDRIGQVIHIHGGQVLEVWTIGEDLAGFDQFLEGVSG